LEQIRRLTDDHRVDVDPVDARIGHRPVHSLTHETGHRHVGAFRSVVGLSSAEYRGTLLSHVASRMVRGFCCKAGPLVACPSARSASPLLTRVAASPMRASPAENIGFPVRAPPEGLIRTSSSRPIASRRISSWCVYGAWISASSTPWVPTA